MVERRRKEERQREKTRESLFVSVPFPLSLTSAGKKNEKLC